MRACGSDFKRALGGALPDDFGQIRQLCTGRQNAKRNRGVEMTRVFGQIGGRKVDSNTAQREFKMAVLKCGSHALPAFSNFGIGNPTTENDGNPFARCASTVTSGALATVNARLRTMAIDI